MVGLGLHQGKVRWVVRLVVRTPSSDDADVDGCIDDVSILLINDDVDMSGDGGWATAEGGDVGRERGGSAPPEGQTTSLLIIL